MRNSDKAVDILCVDDSDADRRLIREFLGCRPRRCNLVEIGDGASAIDYLKRRGRYVRVQRPALVLLDWNLPEVSGADVLHAVKSDPALCDIPVVVLTTSDAASDIARSYQLHANCYLVKPVELDAFENMIRQLDAFWIQTAELRGRRSCA